MAQIVACGNYRRPWNHAVIKDFSMPWTLYRQHKSRRWWPSVWSMQNDLTRDHIIWHLVIFSLLRLRETVSFFTCFQTHLKMPKSQPEPYSNQNNSASISVIIPDNIQKITLCRVIALGSFYAYCSQKFLFYLYLCCVWWCFVKCFLLANLYPTR